MTAPLVSVVVLNWNGLSDTVECIESLLAQTYPNVDIHVVDNASEHPEADEIERRYGDRITLYRNRSNLGFTGGNNVAMRSILEADQGEFIALLNNDAVASPDWLASLVQCASERSDIGIVASCMLYHDHPDIIENTGIALLTSGEGLPRDRGRFAATTKSSSSPIGACAGAVLYRQSMLAEIGVLRDDFFINFEDVEISLRALACGWDIRYSPNARVLHRLNRSIRKVRNEEFLLRSQRNILTAYWTCLPWQVIALNVPSMVLGHFLLMFVAPLCGQKLMSRVIWKSRIALFKDRGRIRDERRRFRGSRRGSWVRIWWRQSNFLSSYMRSFLAVVVARRRRFFE